MSDVSENEQAKGSPQEVAIPSNEFPESKVERALRRMLCVQRHGFRAYMDDGEASWGGGDYHRSIDYMRETPEKIQEAWTAAGLKKYALINDEDFTSLDALSDEELKDVEAFEFHARQTPTIGSVMLPSALYLKLLRIVRLREPVLRKKEDVYVLPRSHLNKPQITSVQHILKTLQHCHYANLTIRINGQDEVYQADWLKHLENGAFFKPTKTA